MTSVSAGHIILTPTQPVGSGRPKRELNPGPRSRALYRLSLGCWTMKTLVGGSRDKPLESSRRVSDASLWSDRNQVDLTEQRNFWALNDKHAKKDKCVIELWIYISLEIQVPPDSWTDTETFTGHPSTPNRHAGCAGDPHQIHAIPSDHGWLEIPIPSDHYRTATITAPRAKQSKLLFRLNFVSCLRTGILRKVMSGMHNEGVLLGSDELPILFAAQFYWVCKISGLRVAN